jgi:GAF domain-containing protein
MNRSINLLDQFTQLVTAAEHPQRLAERTVEVVMALVNGRSAGVFGASDDRLTLFASRSIDQHVLDAVEAIWRRARNDLRGGQPVYVPDCTSDPDLADVTAGGPASLAMFPVLEGGTLVALLYVDGAEPHFCDASDIERLAKFSAVLARAIQPSEAAPLREATAWEAYLERTPVEDIERQKLLLLLNRNEWNIARVARLMNVTRRTIYLRLQRYNIRRERVYKSRLRSQAAS